MVTRVCCDCVAYVTAAGVIAAGVTAMRWTNSATLLLIPRDFGSIVRQAQRVVWVLADDLAGHGLALQVVCGTKAPEGDLLKSNP